MGAKTGMLVYGDGDIAAALRLASTPDPAATAGLVGRVYPNWHVSPEDGNLLGDATYPPDGITYAASLSGVDVVCDQRWMIDYPSQLPGHLVEASAGRTLVMHAMHSVVDWLAFAVWQDGKLTRSLSLSPDSGIVENLGEPLPFESAYWAGQHPVEPIPGWPNQEPYPLPFHPLELGEDALRAFFGFVLEGVPDPNDLEPYGIEMLGYRLIDPDGPDPEAKQSVREQALRDMEPPRFFRFGPDGTMYETELE
jgi:hypothetical protein